jgi:serine/threonine-protein kinase HipA
MKNNVVSVFLWGKEICRLEWRGGYKQGFGKLGAVVTFSPNYAEDPWDLDPLGPYNKGMFWVRQGLSDWCRATEYEGIPRFISSSLPDDWGNAVFAAWVAENGLRHRDITAVDKLSFIGKRGMGALEFVPAAYQASGKDALVLEQLYEVAKAIQQERENYLVNLNTHPGIGELMTVGMSAGGMHPKAFIAINWDTGEVKSGQVDLPDGFVHYILKFKDSATWPGAEIEYAYYLMAVKCGIDMMPCRLLEIHGDKHFLTERFDRKGGEKIHAATLNSLCGPTHTYEEIFAAARRLGVPHADLVQLFRRAVFNYMAGVCDDHDKNFSFTMDRNGRWHLSPAYDLTFTVNLKNPFIGDRHAMSLMGKERNITEKDFIRLAEINDIRAPRTIINCVADALQAFDAFAREATVPEQMIEVILNFLPIDSILSAR